MSETSTFPKGLAVCTIIALVGLTVLLVSLIRWQPDQVYVDANGEVYEGPHYAFYDLNGTPLESISPPRQSQPAASTSAESLADAANAAPTIEASSSAPPSPIAPIWVVQAGAFPNAKDAKARRAELLLLGLDSHVEIGTGANGEPWHRVIIGPIASDQELETTQLKLSEAEIEQLTKTLTPSKRDG